MRSSTLDDVNRNCGVTAGKCSLWRRVQSILLFLASGNFTSAGLMTFSSRISSPSPPHPPISWKIKLDGWILSGFDATFHLCLSVWIGSFTPIWLMIYRFQLLTRRIENPTDASDASLRIVLAAWSIGCVWLAEMCPIRPEGALKFQRPPSTRYVADRAEAAALRSAFTWRSVVSFASSSDASTGSKAECLSSAVLIHWPSNESEMRPPINNVS